MSLEVSHLSYAYGTNKVLSDISFCAKEGQMLCVLGANGVGKSTLFKNILKILPDYQGTIRIEGQDIKGLTIEQLAHYIAYIPQSYAPTFNYSVFDMVLMGTTVSVPSFFAPGRTQRILVEETLERLGITYLKNQGFANISGGERQLTLIARALVQQTKVLLMDEPTANLDYGNQIRVLDQVKKLTKEGYTIIQSTHQPEQAFLFASQVLALKQGKVLAAGKPKEIVTAKLIKELYEVEVKVESLHEDKFRVCIPVSALREE